MQQSFQMDCLQRVEENFKAMFPMMSSDRWLSIRLESLGAFVVLFCALYAILGETTSAGMAGLTLSYAINLTQFFGRCMRVVSQLENDLVAVERLKEYSSLPIEAPWKLKSTEPVKTWPQDGSMSFKDYSVKYRENLELVLRNLTFNVSKGERIGIVGRTGAGKSSLTLALFRILEASAGDIRIDDVTTASLGLHDLRSKISIIPQDPVIFSGTLRSNLDPFHTHSDQELWNVLQLAHLKDFVSSLDEGLDHECAEAGENLSIGQRQLVCLARALLRDSRILVLDEATAAVDLETDALIQTTIREEFKRCTILTIAHRLNTIMDYDRVMVIDKGEIVEFDDPRKLVADKTSSFHAMAKDAEIV
jgi:ATP-binding cassette subfamily C (CFTR/MRP) protein 1